MCSFASQYLGCSSASAAARIGSLPCFGSGLDVWHGNVPRRVLHTLYLGAIAGNSWQIYVSLKVRTQNVAMKKGI
jgi:hypothetical protein